jgi:hypothetical protein
MTADTPDGRPAERPDHRRGGGQGARRSTPGAPREVRPGGVILQPQRRVDRAGLGELVNGDPRAAPGCAPLLRRRGRPGGPAGRDGGAGARRRRPISPWRLRSSPARRPLARGGAAPLRLRRGLRPGRRPRPGEENALDGRYLGSDPEAVIPGRGPSCEASTRPAIGGCLKHFPGLGPSPGRHPLRHRLGGRGEAGELEADLEPFARAGRDRRGSDGRPRQLPGLDPERARRRSRAPSPAPCSGTSASPALVVSDDLEMRALDPWGDVPERAASALLAGCDLLPVCHTLEAAPEILDRLERPGLAGRLAEARDRLSGYRQALREHSPPEPPDLATVRARLEEVRAASRPPNGAPSSAPTAGAWPPRGGLPRAGPAPRRDLAPIGRQVGVSWPRGRHRATSSSATPTKLDLPDVGRLRGGVGRFRGLRLVHTHLRASR